mgnify:CR=1 FL=1
MAKQNLNVGSAANDGTGDTLRDGAIKLNSVIDELYTNLGNDTNLQVNIGAPVNDQVCCDGLALRLQNHTSIL